MSDGLMALIAILVIIALVWDNREHPHVWAEDDEDEGGAGA